jgi:hypothetical protein
MPKLLVMDKSIFHGTSTGRLIKFVKVYQVVLPNTLGVECIISDDENGKRPLKNPCELLEKLCILIKRGAYSGRSMGSMINRERETQKPNDCIIDYQSTDLTRKANINFDTLLIKNEAEKAKKAFRPMIDFCKTIAIAHYENLVKKNMQKSFIEECEQSNPEKRLKRWIQAADKLREQILNRQLASLSFYITEKNDKWLNWQLLRIYLAWAIEWASKRNQSGPSYSGDIENDFYDMEYIAYLNNADGILSNDGNLVLPLSKAAFPEKDVFSSIDEVTEDYRC